MNVHTTLWPGYQDLSAEDVRKKIKGRRTPLEASSFESSAFALSFPQIFAHYIKEEDSSGKPSGRKTSPPPLSWKQRELISSLAKDDQLSPEEYREKVLRFCGEWTVRFSQARKVYPLGAR